MVYEEREVNVDNIKTLMWPEKDVGAFGDPLKDWIEIRPHILEATGDRRGTVVQAGGCCGMYPKFYSALFDKVYTFEPDVENFGALILNCPESNIEMYNSGLGSKIGVEKFQKAHEGNVGMGLIHSSGDLEVSILTIDDVLGENNVDVIHLDVEGYEEKALIGAFNMIERCKPVIITERSRGKDYLREVHRYDVFSEHRMDTIFVKK